MKVTIPDISQQDELPDLKRFTAIALQKIVDALTQNLTFSDNFNGKIVGATFSVSNTEVAIAHGLGRVPTGFIPTLPSAAMSIYNGTTAWTTSNIYLKSSAVGSAQILVF